MNPTQKPTAAKKFIQYGLTAFFVGAIIIYLWKNQDEFLLIQKISFYNILILTCILIFTNLLNAYKIFIILIAQGLKDASFFRWLKIFITSRFINFHVPQGSHLYRFVKLKKDFNFPYTQSLGLTIYFLWFEIVAYLIFSVFALNILVGQAKEYSYAIMLLSGLLFIVCALPLLLGFLLRKLNVKPTFLKRFDEHISSFLESFKVMNADLKLLTKLFLLAIIFAIVQCILIGYSFYALGIQLTLQQIVLFTIIFILTRLINILPNNVGLAEVLLGHLAKILGSSAGAGIIVSTIIRIISYVLLGACSAVIALKERKRLN